MTQPKQLKEGHIVDDETVRRVDAVLCGHLKLSGAGDAARNLSRHYFNTREADVRKVLARARKALTDLTPAIAFGALEPAAIRGWNMTLARAEMGVPQNTKPRATWIADQAAGLWEQRFGERPGVSVREVNINGRLRGHRTDGAFVAFLGALYGALGIKKASAASQAQAACARLRIKSSAKN